MTPSGAVAVAQRAGFVSRLAAFVIDAVIIAAMVHGAAWMLGALARNLGPLAPPVNLSRLVVAGSPLLIAVYLVVFWSVSGQTPGKWLMGLRVVTVEGGRVTVGRAMMRLVGYVLSALPLHLGFFWILGPQRRGWHDRVARTEVVYVHQSHEPRSRATELRQRLRERDATA